MFAGNSVEQVVPGPDFTAGVKNVTVPEGRLVFNIMIVMSIMIMMVMMMMMMLLMILLMMLMMVMMMMLAKMDCWRHQVWF